MDKLKGIKAFIHIAEGGSLTAASHRLDVSLPTVVRTLAELERHLGVTLVYPHSRLLSTKVRLFVAESAPELRAALLVPGAKRE